LVKNMYLLILVVGTAIFAASNVVTFSDKILFQYPLPDFLLGIFSIFRASSRMFYLSFYVIFLCVIVLLSRFPQRKGFFLVLLLITLQLVDIYPALSGRRKHFANYSDIVGLDIASNDFNKILSQFDYFITYDHRLPRNENLFAIAKNNMITNGDFSNRRATDQEHQFRDDAFNDLFLGNPNPQYVYSFTDRSTLWQYYNKHSDKLFFVEIDNFQYYNEHSDKLFYIEMNNLLLLIPRKENITIPIQLDLPIKANGD